MIGFPGVSPLLKQKVITIPVVSGSFQIKIFFDICSLNIVGNLELYILFPGTGKEHGTELFVQILLSLLSEAALCIYIYTYSLVYRYMYL